MILDALLQFSANQTVGVAQADVASTNVLDFGINGIPISANGGGARDMGIGCPLKLLVQMSQGLDSSTDSVTLQVHIEGAPDNGSGSPGSYERWWSSPAYTVAEAKTGARLLDIDFPRPPQGAPIPRYVRLVYTLATENPSAGLINAFVVLDRIDQPYKGADNSVLGGYQPGIAIAN